MTNFWAWILIIGGWSAIWGVTGIKFFSKKGIILLLGVSAVGLGLVWGS